MSAAGPSQPLIRDGGNAREDAGAFRLLGNVKKAARRWRFFRRREAPVTPDADTRHRGSYSFKESPRLTWNVLRELFPDDEDNLNSMERSRSVDDEGPSDRERPDNDGMELTVENIKELTTRFKQEAVQKKAPDGVTLIHHTIMKEAFDAADFLFEYAWKEELLVDLRWDNGDILEHSLAQYSRASVKFVLEKMSQRCASLRETIQVLTENLEKLLERFPDIFEKFLVNDKLCFALAKLSVPKSIFDGTDTKPIGFICDYDPGELKWKMHYEPEVRQFLKDQCPRILEEINSHKGEIITALLKFVPLEDVVVSGRKMSTADITAAKYSVNVFKCETVRTMVQWKWHNYQMFAFVLSNSIVYLTSVFFFFSFALIYDEMGGALGITDVTDDHGSSSQRLAQVLLACSFLALVFPVVLRASTPIWSLVVGGVGSEIYLLVHVFVSSKHNNFSAIVVSIHCLTIVFQILRYLRPFRRFAPFVATYYSVLTDLQPFALMGSTVVINFGVALFVLLGRSHQLAREIVATDEVLSERPQQPLEDLIGQYLRDFSSIWRCFEYLLYAIVGNFETEIFRLSLDDYLTGWITLFFALYVLLAAIVLLSLLISVLGDSFDRVMMQEDAHCIKYRAQAISQFTRVKLWWLEKRSLLTSCRTARSSPWIKKFYMKNRRLIPVGNGVAVFHFLVPAETSIEPDATVWRGRIRAVTETTKEVLQEQQERENTQVENLRNELDTVKRDIASLREEMNGALGEILCRLPARETGASTS